MFKVLKRVFSEISASKTKAKHSLGVIGVPFCKGQKKDGVDNAPNVMRNAGLLKILENDCRKVIDYGNISYQSENIDPLDNMRNLCDVIGCNKALFYKTKEILKNNDQLLVLGGDHSIAIGSIGGHLSHDPNIAVIWIDAHADINVNTSSHSGSIHGMPLSLLLDESKEYWKDNNPTSSWLKNRLPANRLVYIGLRDIDPFEVDLIRKFNIKAFGMDAIDKFGISRIMEMCLDSIDPNGKLNYHVSLDVDGLDPNITPSTGTPVLSGLTLREGLHIMETISDTGRLSGMDLVEINPKLGTRDDVDRTIKSAIEMTKAAFGQSSRIQTRQCWLS